MAITKLVMPASPVPTDATATGDWFKLMAHMTALQLFTFTKPFILTGAKDTVVPAIQQGTYIQHAGSVYIVDTADEVIEGTPADGTVYIRVEVDGDYLVATFVTDVSAYVWNAVYGYMEDVANGYHLLPYALVKSGTSYTKYRWDVMNNKIEGALGVVGSLTVGGAVTVTGALTCATVDTGNGATEIYDMNQDLKTTDSPEFKSLYITGLFVFVGPTSTILSSFAAPSDAGGITFDGMNLINCDAGTDRIYIHSGVSGTILSSFAAPATQPLVLAFDGTHLISVDGITDLVYIHDGISSIILSSFAVPGTYTTGLTFDGINLISCDSNKRLIYIHDGVSSTILSSFASPSTSPTGLAFDGVNLISCDSGTDKIYIHDGVSATILSSFTVPASAPVGLTYSTTDLISRDSGTHLYYIHKTSLVTAYE